MTIKYTDLLIKIQQQRENEKGYPVEAELSDGSHFGGGRFEPDLAALRSARLDPAAYGRELFYALFTGPLRRAYDRALGRAQAETEGRLSIRLRIADKAAAVHALRWESLHQPHAGREMPLAVSAQRTFSRYLPLEMPEPTPIAARQLKLLYVISNPSDLAAYELASLSVTDELAPLLNSLRGLRQTQRLNVTLLPGRAGIPEPLRGQLLAAGYRIAAGNATLDNLVRLLSESGGYHSWQFVGHGALVGGTAQAVLYLEDELGKTAPTSADAIATRLAGLDLQPALVLLSACESARRFAAGQNPFVGLAPQLVRAGIPAVIAMQDKIPIATARELTSDFYRYLLVHGRVDRALSEARLLLYEEGRSSWAIPALFTRLSAGQLFMPDPFQSLLGKLITAPQFNPLAEGQSYIPARVVRLAGSLGPVDLDYLTRERNSDRAITAAFAATFTSPTERRMVGLIGKSGMGKSLQLRRLGRWTAEQALESESAELIIPLYVDLSALFEATSIDYRALEKVFLAALELLAAEHANFPLQTVLSAKTGPRLRILVDGSDRLPPRLRRWVWEALATFAWQHPRHQYLIGCQPDNFIADLLPFTDLLIMQPLSPDSVRHYLLKTVKTPAGAELYAALERGALFDLAAYPWLLLQMLAQTEQHAAPLSHLSVLRDYVDSALAKVSAAHGRHSRAAHSLYALAWQLQSSHRHTLSSTEVFTLLAEVRGRRDYLLEELVQDLYRVGLLKPVGEDSWRFARESIRAYCCAQALWRREDREQRLDDIAATLGRHSRYHWWRHTWLLLAGLWDDTAALLRILLRDAALNEGETVFLAVHCLQESLAQIPGSTPDPKLHNYLVRALLQRLDSQREPRAAFRIRAIESLALLRASSALPRLVALATEKVRGVGSKRTYEYSSVRLAVMQALHEIVGRDTEELAALNPALSELLELWEARDIASLAARLEPEKNSDGLQALVAFALGEIGTEPAGEVLVRVFLSPTSSSLTRRNVSTALTELEPDFVTTRVILPLLSPAAADEGKLAPEVWEQRAIYSSNLIYLIGRLRVHHPLAGEFLQRRLTANSAGYRQKGLVLQSLGWLHARKSKKMVEAVAWGDFTALNPSSSFSELEQQYLRRKALSALYYLGDIQTLERLQKRTSHWGQMLEQACYWAGEGIRARLQKKIR